MRKKKKNLIGTYLKTLIIRMYWANRIIKAGISTNIEANYTCKLDLQSYDNFSLV